MNNVYQDLSFYLNKIIVFKLNKIMRFYNWNTFLRNYNWNIYVLLGLGSVVEEVDLRGKCEENKVVWIKVIRVKIVKNIYESLWVIW